MKNNLRGLQKLALPIMLIVLGFLIWANYTELRSPGFEAREIVLPSFTPKPEITPRPETITLPLPRAENTVSITLAAAGDTVVHSGLNTQAWADGGEVYDYTKIFEGAAKHFKSADFAVATLETVLAGDHDISAYPMFRSPDALAESLALSGISLVNTATNHVMDGRFKSGIDRTLDRIEAAGMEHVGTYRTLEDRTRTSGITIVETDGIKIAFLSYTYGTNGIPLYTYDSNDPNRRPLESFEYAVNTFNRNYASMPAPPSEVRYDQLRTDMETARGIGADIIAVFMHWGTEYEITPNETQISLADFLFAEGADIILGSHPHVPQPIELRYVTDRDGNERIGFIIYSLGNFVSCMHEREYADLTSILNIEIEKNQDTGETYIWDVSYAPMYMADFGENAAIETGVRYRLLDIHEAIAAHESGANELDAALYEKLRKGLDDLHGILGKEYDAHYK